MKRSSGGMVFLEALRDNGLPVSEEQVFYGNFWMNTAQDFANEILNGEVNLRARGCSGDRL